MTHSPLAQFQIKKLVDLNLFGVDISVTNSSMLMLLIGSLIISYLLIAVRKEAVIPSRLQMSAESLYSMITNMLDQNIGQKGRVFSPLIFTLFLFILLCNLFGMIPYSFTVTSHISITFALAILVFCTMLVVGFVKHGLKFFSVLLPDGVPLWLAPLMIMIELFTYLARPVSLSLRLGANMVAGHILLKVIAGFAVSLVVFFKWLPLPLIVVLIGFEFFVAVLQAYIFTILSCVYLNDAVNLH